VTRRGVLVLLLLAAAACERKPEPQAPAPPAPAPAERAATAPSGYRTNASLPHGSVVVQVRARSPAESRKVDISDSYRARNPHEASLCDVWDERLVVDRASLGVRNVAVSVRSIAQGLLPPLGRATLDNAGCRFVPRVLFAPVGAKLLLKNSDAMSHGTMLSTLGGTALFTTTIPSGETADTTTIDVPGILSVTCPLHAWMQGWVVATRHPYVAVTGDLGEARLAQVPAGAHNLVFWHESLGTASRSVTVTAGQEQRVELDDSAFQKK
jgi:hypothetical protein